MRDIIVFGKGWYFEKKRKELEKECRIAAYLDNAANSSSEVEVSDNITYLPEKIHKLPQIPIVIFSVHFIDMWKQLIELEVDENRIDFGVNYPPFFDCTEEALYKNKGRVRAKNGILWVSFEDKEIKFSSTKEYIDIMNKLVRDSLNIDAILELPTIPFSRRFGRERGTPVDRYYIEEFVKSNSKLIQGDVMEIGDSFYTKKYGNDVRNSYIMHALGLGENAIKGDLVTGKGIKEEFLDCFICTQTLQVIYDIESTVKNLYRSLKHNGIALVTMHGISQLSVSDYNRWGEYWRFTVKSAKLLFEKYFDEVNVCSYGNVKIATALLYGLCMEDLDENDYMVNDKYYPVLITVIAKKKMTAYKNGVISSEKDNDNL